MEDKDIDLTVSSGARGATEPVAAPQQYDITAESDPMAWALEFQHVRERVLAQTGQDIASDPGAMVGWFANAFQRGEWNSPHYKAWVEEHLRELYPSDDDPLDLVGTNKHDIGRPHAGGEKTIPVKTAQEYRRMIMTKQDQAKPLFTLQFDEDNQRILITDIDETRLKRKR